MPARAFAFAIAVTVALVTLRSIIDQVNAKFVLLLALPVVVAALPLFVPRFKLPSAIILLFISLIGAIGFATLYWFFFPAALMMFFPERMER